MNIALRIVNIDLAGKQILIIMLDMTKDFLFLRQKILPETVNISQSWTNNNELMLLRLAIFDDFLAAHFPNPMAPNDS